jgi:hypothetical protein
LPPEVVFRTVRDTSGISQEYIRIPLTLLDIKEKYLSLNAGIRQNKTVYFDLELPLSGTMSVGYVKTGFLKTKPVGIFTSENPYLKINNMDILIVQEQKKWYEKFWVHALFGGAIVEGVNILIK